MLQTTDLQVVDNFTAADLKESDLVLRKYGVDFDYSMAVRFKLQCIQNVCRRLSSNCR